MFEKLLDVLTLLITAIQDNTKAHSAPVVRDQQAAAPAATADAQTKPPKAPKPPKAEAPAVAPQAPAAPKAPDFGGAKKAPAPPLPDMTIEQANEALSQAWSDLGGTDVATQKIFNVFAEYGVAGLTQLPDTSKYAEIVAKVKALIP